MREREPQRVPCPAVADRALGEKDTVVSAVNATVAVSSHTDPSTPSSVEPVRANATSQVRTRSLVPGGVDHDFRKQFELGRAIGSGGMGSVFRAQDHALHRVVAIKVMHEEIAAQDVMARRFYKEAQIAGQLEHPGIVPIYGIHLSGGKQPRLAMRLIRGQDLDALIREHRRLENEGERHRRDKANETRLLDRLELFVRTCDAVHFAHERGVVHRDIKPQNIMVGPHRDAYVMDWGLATLTTDSEDDDEPPPSSATPAKVEVDDDPKATICGDLIGTIAYMPPEQALGHHERVGPAADQYALGMVLQELITLRDPRSCENVMAALSQASLGGRVPLPSTVPPGLAAVVEKATAAAPEDRFPSVAALADDVRRFLRGEELSVYPDPLSRKIWKRLSRHQGAVLGILLLLVVGVASLAVAQVVEKLRHERAQAEQAQRIAALVGTVAARAQAIDARIRGVETELAAVAALTERALSQPSAVPPDLPIVRPSDLDGPGAPADTAFVERYNQKVSFDRAVTTRAPTSPAEAAERDEAALATLEVDVRRAYDRGGFVRGSGSRNRGAPLQWVYIGTRNGVLLNYPGAAGLKPDYDPRERPWYRSAANANGARWGELYGDASGSGTLLPSNRAVWSRSGQLLGVVGIDFRLKDVQSTLGLGNLQGYQAAWLLDGEGRIIAAPEGQQDLGEPEDTGKREKVPFQHEKVLDAIEGQPSSGQVVVGKSRYVYAAVAAIGYTYVVAVRK